MSMCTYNRGYTLDIVNRLFPGGKYYIDMCKYNAIFYRGYTIDKVSRLVSGGKCIEICVNPM